MESVLLQHGIDSRRISVLPHGIDSSYIERTGGAASPADRFHRADLRTQGRARPAGSRACPCVNVQLPLLRANLNDFPEYVQRLPRSLMTTRGFISGAHFSNADVGKVISGFDVIVVSGMKTRRS